MSDWLQESVVFIPNWKWLSLLLSLIAGFLLIGLARHFFQNFQLRLSQRQRLPVWLRHVLQQQIHVPLSWLTVVAFWFFILQSIHLPDTLAKHLSVLLTLLMAYHLIRLAYKSTDAAGSMLAEFAQKTENSLDNQLAPFVTKTLKVFVVIFGGLMTLQSFGFNVMSVLAGLGIGGLALALAAQDTAANLFGSITIITDRPFQVGDWIKVGDTEGVVEEVGFRSTRVRTFYNSLITIPNATMAKERIDNLGARPARRLRHVLGLEYSTPIEKIHHFIDRVRYIAAGHPQAVKDSATVSFHALGDFSLQVLLVVHVNATELIQESKIQEEILLEVLKAARELGVEFAFPTQTIHTHLPT